MLSKKQARLLAIRYITESDAGVESESVIIDEYTIERDFGWVFCYQSRRYLETGDVSDAFMGNAPIIVNKFDGSLHITGTALPVEKYIQDYEASISTE